MLLFLLDSVGAGDTLFSMVAHGFILIIGILTGMEIPLLVAVRNLKLPDSDVKVLGMDYIGACLGALVFAFVLYPQTGLTRAAFFIALLNSVVGLMLGFQRLEIPREQQKRFRSLLGLQAALALVLMACFVASATINEYLVALYLA